MVPPNMEVRAAASTSAGVTGQAGGTVYYLVRQDAAVVTGRDLRNARPSLDENNRPAVSFSLNNEGAREVRPGDGREHRHASSPSSSTAACSRRRASRARITDEGRITGSFTQEEAPTSSLKLRSGALPASLTYLEERTVGPTLGADSIRAGVIASLVGLALVALVHAVLLPARGHQRHRVGR